MSPEHKTNARLTSDPGSTAQDDPTLDGEPERRYWNRRRSASRRTQGGGTAWSRGTARGARLGNEHPGGASASETLSRSARREQLLDSIAAQLVRKRRWTRLRLGLDVLVLAAAVSLSLLGAPSGVSAGQGGWLAGLFSVAALALIHLRRAPDDRLSASVLETLANVIGVSSLAAMITICAESIVRVEHPLRLVLRLWIFAVVYLGCSRFLLVNARRGAMSRDALRTPTLIVGAGVIGAHLANRLSSDSAYGLRPIGYVDADPLHQSLTGVHPLLPVLGSPDNIADVIARTGARHVILSFSSGPDYTLVSVVRTCERLGIDVSLVPRLYESVNERSTLDHVGGLPLLTLNAINPRGWQFAIKHALDRGVATISVLVLSPLLLTIAVAVRLSSPGPVLFRQRRVGRDGHEFTMLKFRSMRGSPNAEGEADAGWAAVIRGELPGRRGGPISPGLDRTTRVGRILRDSSLDELAQLFNVLRGDMSLVGPRPERVAYVRDFEQYVARYSDRHRVKSGLTGWAQVNGLRGETSISDRIEWDNHYIANWSLGFDFRIILMTVAEMLRRSDRPGEIHPGRAKGS